MIQLLALLLFCVVIISEPITLTYWPSANPDEVRLAKVLIEKWQRLHPQYSYLHAASTCQ